MHELSLCQAIIETMQQGAAEHHYETVKGVRLEIGPFAAVDEAALRFAFDVAKENTLAAGARLEIIKPAATAHCRACGQESEIAQRFDPCPRCGSHELELLSGEELRILDLEVA